MQLRYSVVWTNDILSIGCQQKTIEEWLSLSDEELESLDEQFFKDYGDIIRGLIDER